VFRGTYEHTIDPKGRLSIPSRYREELTARSITTLVLSEADHCIWAFPLDAWEELEERLRRHPQLSPERRNVVRVLRSLEARTGGKIIRPQAEKE